MAKRVVKLRTSPKCAICKSGDDVRDRVDNALALIGEVDPKSGERVTWAYILGAVLPHLLGAEISKTSVRRHLGTYGDSSPHTSLVDDDEEAEKLEAAASTVETGELLDEIDALLDGENVSPTAVLGLQLKAWLLSIRRKVALGEEVQLTADQAQRAASVLLKSEKMAVEQELLGAVSGGLSRAFQQAFPSAPGRAALKPAIEIVDADVLAEEDAKAVPPPPPPLPPPAPPPAEVVVEPVPEGPDEKTGGYRDGKNGNRKG